MSAGNKAMITRPILIVLLTAFVLTGCGNSVTKNDKATIDSRIGEFFQQSSYTNAKVSMQDYRKADMELSEIGEYKQVYGEREKNILSLCALLKHNSRFEASHHHHHDHDHDAPGHNCEDHVHANDLEKYGFLVEAQSERLHRIEAAYTPDNYIVQTVLDENEKNSSTPIIFYLNSRFEIMAVEVEDK